MFTVLIKNPATFFNYVAGNKLTIEGYGDKINLEIQKNKAEKLMCCRLYMEVRYGYGKGYVKCFFKNLCKQSV